jgi:hypothetical protein
VLHVPPILLDLITLITSGEVNTLWSSSLCSLLQPPASYSVLGPNILLSTSLYFSNEYFRLESKWYWLHRWMAVWKPVLFHISVLLCVHSIPTKILKHSPDLDKEGMRTVWSCLHI